MKFSDVFKIVQYGKIVAKVLDAKGVNVKGVPVSHIVSAVETALTSEQQLEPLVKDAVKAVQSDLKK